MRQAPARGRRGVRRRRALPPVSAQRGAGRASRPGEDRRLSWRSCSSRLDAQLVAGPRRAPVLGQRLGLAAGAVEGEHHWPRNARAGVFRDLSRALRRARAWCPRASSASMRSPGLPAVAPSSRSASATGEGGQSYRTSSIAGTAPRARAPRAGSDEAKGRRCPGTGPRGPRRPGVRSAPASKWPRPRTSKRVARARGWRSRRPPRAAARAQLGDVDLQNLRGAGRRVVPHGVDRAARASRRPRDARAGAWPAAPGAWAR